MSKKKYVYIVVAFVLLFVIATIVAFKNNLEEKQRLMIQETNKKDLEMAKMLMTEANKSESYRYKNDSLATITRENIAYRELVRKMVARDMSGKSELPEVGSIVIFKNDSTRGVLSDIIIGGGKFDYYVKCRVVRKDGTATEIKPEMLIFEKKD